MIARIAGTVVDILEKGLVLDVNGIGYLIYTPMTIPLASKVTLHTHMVVREDSHELYGFETVEEKILFTKLIGVTGVGPKTGLHMLTLYPMNELVRLIKTGDAKAIALVPGIGKKTAEKVVIDLKDKLEAFESAETGPQSDLVEALLSLGYKEYQVRTVVPSIDTSLPLQKQIASALQIIQK